MDAIGRLLRTQHVPEVKLIYRPARARAPHPTISSSYDAYCVLLPHFNECMETYESFKVLLLDRANRCKAIATISTGGVTGTIVDPKIVFGFALRSLSCGIVLAHNHPSGQLRASEEDIAITRKLSNAARLLDIEVKDHLIITRRWYFSWVDGGLL